MAAETVTTDKHSEMDRILSEMAILNGATVLAGIFNAAIAKYAAINELGTRDQTPGGQHVVPERAFMRLAFERNKKRYQEIQDRGLVDILRGRGNAKSVLIKIGLAMENDIKTMIRDWRTLGDKNLKNAESTKRAKMSLALRAREAQGEHIDVSTLIDSGTMRNAVSFEVSRKNRAEVLATHGPMKDPTFAKTNREKRREQVERGRYKAMASALSKMTGGWQ